MFCQRPGWDGKMAEARAGQRYCRWYMYCLLVRAVVQCGAEKAGGERHPQTQWKETSSKVCVLV